MTWVTAVPTPGVETVRHDYAVYYRTRDGKLLRWHGGISKAQAQKEAKKVLALDRAKTLYRFTGATIVHTTIVEAVTAHIEVTDG